MNIGPIEYLVIGLPDSQFKNEILPEITSISEKGLIRVIDLLFISKDAEGNVKVSEVNDQIPEDDFNYGGIRDDFLNLLSDSDIEQLATSLPPNTSAVVIVFEHNWVLGLTEAVHRAGGTVFTGGLVGPAELIEINAELAEKEEQHA